MNENTIPPITPVNIIINIGEMNLIFDFKRIKEPTKIIIDIIPFETANNTIDNPADNTNPIVAGRIPENIF